MKNRFFKLCACVCAVILSLSFVGCGESAYDIAVKHGFTGTEEQWLETLKGDNGHNGQDGQDGENNTITIESLYESAVKNGYTGDFLQFVKEYVDENTEKIDSTLAASQGLLSTVVVVARLARGTSNGAGVFYKLDKEKGNAYVITNFHVVYNDDTGDISKDIKIRLYGCDDKDTIDAEYVGGSMIYDIAVLSIKNNKQLKNSQARAVKVGDSDHLKVGSTAIAIGNPDTDGISATSGIISVDSEYIKMVSLDGQSIVTFRCIRVDTAINGGNSGGGLYNAKGELIGIVNAKSIKNGIENIGYAIPSSIATSVADNIIWNSSRGKKCVSKGLIGVLVDAKDGKAVYNEELHMTEIIEKSVVSEIKKGSISDGHLKLGDVITAIERNGKKVDVTRRFMVVDYMLKARPGDEIKVHITRNDKPLSYTFIMEENDFQDMP